MTDPVITLPATWETGDPDHVGDDGVYQCRRALQAGVEIRIDVVERAGGRYQLRIAIVGQGATVPSRYYPVVESDDVATVLARTEHLCAVLERQLESGALTDRPQPDDLRPAIAAVTKQGLLGAIVRKIGRFRRR